MPKSPSKTEKKRTRTYRIGRKISTQLSPGLILMPFFAISGWNIWESCGDSCSACHRINILCGKGGDGDGTRSYTGVFVLPTPPHTGAGPGERRRRKAVHASGGGQQSAARRPRREGHGLRRGSALGGGADPKERLPFTRRPRAGDKNAANRPIFL